MKQNINNKKKSLGFKTESLEVIKRNKGYTGVPTREEFIVRMIDNEFSNKGNEAELVIYKDDRIQISSIGFDTVIDKNNDDELMFAYQLKTDEGVCIIHIPSELSKDNLMKLKYLLGKLKVAMKNERKTDIKFVSSKKYISPILNEIGTLVNLNKQDLEIEKEIEGEE